MLIRHLYALMQRHEAALGMGTTWVGAVLTPTAVLTFDEFVIAATSSAKAKEW